MIVERRIKLACILRSVGPPLIALLAYDIAVTVLFVVDHQRWIGVDNLPLTLLGSALVIIVGLRNNASYARWWEARTLWGSAVNNSRSLARGAIAMLRGREGKARAAALVHLQIAWAHALCSALRRQDPWGELKQLLPDDVLPRVRGAANVPSALQAEMGRLLTEADQAGALDSMRLAALDRTLSELANAQGGLERIKNTPLPRQFDQFPRVFIAAYCLLLPVGLVTDLGAATPIGSTVIGFAFYVLDQIGRDLENPFEGTPHDVPMSAITRTIEIDLRQMLRERETPAPLAPKSGVLW
jgi:ion channel-forming bestrophin family protein